LASKKTTKGKRSKKSATTAALPARRKGSVGRPPKGEQLGDGVIGVSPHAKGYQIRYVQGGKRRYTYRKTKRAADLLELDQVEHFVGEPGSRIARLAAASRMVAIALDVDDQGRRAAARRRQTAAAPDCLDGRIDGE
jgi:hypothetical protein